MLRQCVRDLGVSVKAVIHNGAGPLAQGTRIRSIHDNLWQRHNTFQHAGVGCRLVSTKSMGELASEAGIRPPRNMERHRDLDDLFADAGPEYYKLRITTGDLRGAGTTEQVFIELHGDNGSSGQRIIEVSLERASTVETLLEVKGDLGRLQRMEIGFFKGEEVLKIKGSGWLLDRIETYRIDNSMRRIPKPIIFPCQRWIGESESGSRSGGPLQTLFPLAMELSYPRLGSLARVRHSAASAGILHTQKIYRFEFTHTSILCARVSFRRMNRRMEFMYVSVVCACVSFQRMCMQYQQCSSE